MINPDNKVQNNFIDVLITNNLLVSVYIKNGIRLKGYLTRHNNEAVFLKNNVTQLVYKAQISAIAPEIDFSV